MALPVTQRPGGGADTSYLDVVLQNFDVRLLKDLAQLLGGGVGWGDSSKVNSSYVTTNRTSAQPEPKVYMEAAPLGLGGVT